MEAPEWLAELIFKGYDKMVDVLPIYAGLVPRKRATTPQTLIIPLSWTAIGYLLFISLFCAYAALKYDQLCRRLRRRLLHGKDEPADALVGYPVQLDEVAASASGSSRSRSETDMDSRDDGHAVHVPRRPSHAAMPEIPPLSVTTTVTPLRRVGSAPALSSLHVSTGARSPLVGMTGEEEDPAAQQRVVDAVKMLRLLRHTVQGIDLPAALALFPRIEQLELHEGQPLFTAGEPADAMFIVLSGQLDWFAPLLPGEAGAPDATAPAGARGYFGEPLCTFGKGQVVEEYALISGYNGSQRRQGATSSSTAGVGGNTASASAATPGTTGGERLPPVASRPGSCVARTPCRVLRLDTGIFRWFAAHHGASLISFMLATTSRQWRIAHATLATFLCMSDAWQACLEPEAPSLRLAADAGSEMGLSVASSSGSSSSSGNLAQHPGAHTPPLGPHASTPGAPGPIAVSETALRSVADEIATFAAGEVLCRAGDQADSLWVILAGTAHATAVGPIGGTGRSYSGQLPHPHHPGDHHHGSNHTGTAAAGTAGSWRELSPGCIAGGMAAFAEVPHVSTVTAFTEVHAAQFSRATFSSLRAGDGDSGDHDSLTGSGRARAFSLAASGPEASREAVLVALARAVSRMHAPLLHLFSSLALRRTWLRAGETLFRAGDRQDGLYLVTSGRLRTYNTGAAGGAVSAADPERRVVASAGLAESALGSGAQGLPPASAVSLPSLLTEGSYHGGASNEATGDDLHSTSQAHRSVPIDVGRGETVGELAVLTSESSRASSAICVRDCELVHVSASAFAHISERFPSVNAQVARVVAARYRRLIEQLSHGPSSSLPSLVSLHSSPAVTGSGTVEGVLHRAIQRSVEASNRRSVDGMPASSPVSAPPAAPTAPVTAAAPSCQSPFATIAVVPAGALPPCIRSFTRSLVSALRRTSGCSVLHLTSDSIDALWGRGTCASLDEAYVRARVTAWLSAQEERHRFIVFESDEDPDILHPPQCSPIGAAGGSGGSPPGLSMGRGRRGSGDAHFVRLASRARSFGRGLNRLIESTTGVAPGPILRLALHKLATELSGQHHAPGVIEDELLSVLQPGAASAAVHSATAGDGGRASAWSRLCAQHADLCLLVGAAHTPAALSITERQCVYRVMGGSGQTAALGTRAFGRKELVLLHPDASREPRDTRAWLRSRRVASHHHVRTHIPDDTARVARFICGSAHGVVFSGGGSRGLAHLGVLQAMEELSVPVDVIGGTSQGAFTAACYASHMDTARAGEAVGKLANALGSTLRLVQSLTLPIHSWFSGHAFNLALRESFADRQVRVRVVRDNRCLG